MKLREIYEIVDGLAPFALSAEYMTRFGARDNSGILIDLGQEISGVLFSLDLSLAAIEEAKRAGANCIVTHHPAIWDAPKRITPEDTPALQRCMREGISVISAHLNLDAAEGGIDESLMQGLGGRDAAVMEQLTGGGYGRVYDVPAASLEAFAEHVKKTFCTERIVVYGDRPVRRVASFCGAGFGPDAIRFAAVEGADTIVSSDQKHHLVAEAVERGMNVLLLTHYAAENYGFLRFAERAMAQLRIPADTFSDLRLI